MKQDYVVLRLSGLKEGQVLGAPQGAATADVQLDKMQVDEVQVETLAGLTQKDVHDLRRDPSVRSAPAMPVELIVPVDLAADDAAALQPDSGNVAWGLEATRTLTSPFTGQGVTVAVLDTGIDAGHEAFVGRDIVQEDFTGDGNGDHNGHGTHCAGTIFGGDVGGVRIGIARGIERALIGKVLDDQGRGSTENILNGILWAVRNGANVISMSLGFDFPAQVKRNVQQGMVIEAATSLALQAYRENVRLFDDLAALIESQSAQFAKTIVIAAAGNESRRPTFEIATAPPAVARGFISVGALGRAAAGGGNNKFRVASFSNALPRIAGPGVDIRSAKVGSGLTSKNGTSMATPHVAGIAALWLESIAGDNSNFLFSELEGRLIGKASHQAIDKTERPNTGAGLVLAPQEE